MIDFNFIFKLKYIFFYFTWIRGNRLIIKSKLYYIDDDKRRRRRLY